MSAFIEFPNYVSDGPGYTGRILISLQGDKLCQQTFQRKETYESRNFGGYIQRRGVAYDGEKHDYLQTLEVVLPHAAPAISSFTHGTEEDVAKILQEIATSTEELGWKEYLIDDIAPALYNEDRVVMLEFSSGGAGWLLLGGESCFALLKTDTNLYSIEFGDDLETAVYIVK